MTAGGRGASQGVPSARASAALDEHTREALLVERDGLAWRIAEIDRALGWATAAPSKPETAVRAEGEHR